MLETILGSANKEKVLIYLAARDEGYPREIARYYNTDLAPIQQQLEKLEFGGVLYSKVIGRTRLYAFNPRYPFLQELLVLLQKTLEFYPEEVRDNLQNNRRRPRRAGKPI
jgi:hypothetical protein